MRYVAVIVGGVAIFMCLFGFWYEHSSEYQKSWFMCKTHLLNDKDWCDGKLRRP